MFQHYITPEEVNALPLTQYNGRICLINANDRVEQAVDEISTHPVTGFDTESKPTFRKGEHYPISLIQIAVPGTVYLFRINLSGFHPAIVRLMANPSVRKIGVGLKDDVLGLQKLGPFEPAGFEELHDFVKDYDVRNTGLRKLAAILLKVRISKSQQTSNWESAELTEKQLRYAATDAWVCLEMYDYLHQLGVA